MIKRSPAKPLKLDAVNRKILEVVQKHANITNQELAEVVGLSPAACSQRMNGLKDAGYFISFHAEVDLDRLFEHILAYVEITLEDNVPQARTRYEAAIEEYPEFMDCLRLGSGADYIAFTCCSDQAAMNALCDTIAANANLGIKRIEQRLIVDRAKWYYGYPFAKLRWLGD